MEPETFFGTVKKVEIFNWDLLIKNNHVVIELVKARKKAASVGLAVSTANPLITYKTVALIKISKKIT